MSATPLRGTRLAHVGIAVSALEAILPFYRDVLGLPELPVHDKDGAAITGLAAGEAMIELLHPKESGSPVDRFLRRRGPAIHHLCFAVDDLDGALERCRGIGIRLIDETPRMGAEGKRIAFLHPSSTQGVLVELTEY